MRKILFLLFTSLAAIGQKGLVYTPKQPTIRYPAAVFFSYEKLAAKSSAGYGLIDDLTYTYNGNQLVRVEDAISGDHEVDFVNRNAGADDYEYYPNGVLKKDLNEGILDIEYNTFLNKPVKITMTDGRWIKHTYLGDGQLIKTEYSNGEYWEYNNGLIFKNGDFYSIEIPEGRALYVDGEWEMEFDYKDHLGNTRVSFKADGENLVQTARTDLDPFGVFLKNTGKENNIQNRHEMQGHEREMTYNLNRINFGARTYNPTIGRWDNADPLAHEYPSVSPYAYVLNNPINAYDPDGRRVYFIGGANNDRDGWDYINRWRDAFVSAGINNFIRVNATHGKAGDIQFTNNYRNSGTSYEYKSYKDPNGGMYREYTGRELEVNNSMIKKTVELYRQQLTDNPLKDGEQFNLAGYSYGSVLQAQAALQLANKGIVVDNLVLIGSPISDVSKLYQQLSGNKNIKNIIRIDIPNDGLSNPESMSDFIRGGLKTILDGNNAHHFDLARPDKETDDRIRKAINQIKREGVKN